jgi:glyoxylase-like metal-dependent hydrolase (beta-lactamase superfamily II)
MTSEILEIYRSHTTVRFTSNRSKLRADRKPDVVGFFDEDTSHIQYIVSDPETKHCAIINPILDFNAKTGALATTSADRLLRYASAQKLEVEWILDTHPHADHYSAAKYLSRKTGARTGIGAKTTEIQRLWAGIHVWPDLHIDGSQWDHLFEEGETFAVGSIPASALYSPGHTIASVTYVIGDSAFVNDTLLMPDRGTVHANVMGGSANALWQSIETILALPDATRLFVGHDYRSEGRERQCQTTVRQQKAENIHLRRCLCESDFVRVLEERDRHKPGSWLLLNSARSNLDGGALP